MMRNRWWMAAGMVALALAAMGAITVNSLGEGRSSFEQTAIAIGTTVADDDAHCCELPIASWPSEICAEIENTGAVALTDLALQARDHADGAWYTVLNGTDWAETTIATLRYCSSETANTLAASGKVHLWLSVSAPARLRIAASSATATTIAVRGTMAVRK